MVHALCLLPTVAGTTSLNVGKVGGGEAINARVGRRPSRSKSGGWTTMPWTNSKPPSMPCSRSRALLS